MAMNTGAKFWNPYLETLPRERLQQLQFRKFRKITCACQSGGMHINEAMFLAEVEDLETGEIITEPGRKGLKTLQ